jgi:hypothetical protein
MRYAPSRVARDALEEHLRIDRLGEVLIEPGGCPRISSQISRSSGIRFMRNSQANAPPVSSADW